MPATADKPAWIAYLCLIGFTVLVALCGVVAYLVSTQTTPNLELAKLWTDLFKTGYTVLGTAATTVIGYYFGNKVARDALSKLPSPPT